MEVRNSLYDTNITNILFGSPQARGKQARGKKAREKQAREYGMGQKLGRWKFVEKEPVV